MLITLVNSNRCNESSGIIEAHTKLIYRLIKTDLISWSILPPSRETSDTMQKLFYVCLMPLCLIFGTTIITISRLRALLSKKSHKNIYIKKYFV